MKIVHKKCVLLMILLSSCLSLHAQTAQLKKTKSEIQKLESELEAKEDIERSLLERIEDLDRVIGLRGDLLQRLELEKQVKEREIQDATIILRKAEKSYLVFKEIVAQRMVSMYKYGRFSDWEILLTLSSFDQLQVWLSFQKRVMDNDQRNLDILEGKKQEIQEQTERLNREVQNKNRLIREKEAEFSKYKTDKNDIGKLLTENRNDQELVKEQIEEKQKAFDEIKGRIAIVKRRKKTVTFKLDGKPFAALKGKMDWPVQGNVVSEYGTHVHPVLKTRTVNLGIDIKATEESLVRNVCPGVVKSVFWIRGMGNLIMIDHGGGYHTVYGHLDRVAVEPDLEVEEGTILGQVGNKQSLYGSVLHFQVWKDQTDQPPRNWLRKKG